MSDAPGAGRGTRIAAMAAAAFCVTWLMVAAWGAAQYRQASHFGPVLYAPLSLAVDPGDGTIYCASGAGRVQKYGPDGRGRGAFRVDTDGRLFAIASDGPGRVGVVIEGETRVRIFDEGGGLLDEREEPGSAGWAAASLAVPAGDGGKVIALEDAAIVERDAAGARRELVPAISFPLTFFAAAPWTLVASLFFSGLGLMASFIWPFLARSDDPAVR